MLKDRAWWGCLLPPSGKGGDVPPPPLSGQGLGSRPHTEFGRGDSWLVSRMTSQRSWGLREGTGSPQHTQQAANSGPKLQRFFSELPLAQGMEAGLLDHREPLPGPQGHNPCPPRPIFFPATALLRYNSPTAQFSHFTRTTQRLYVRAQSRAARHHDQLENISISPKGNRGLAGGTPNLAFPRPGSHESAVSEDVTIPGIPYMESYAPGCSHLPRRF